MDNTKPSGIDWIGDIPAEWELTRIKYCYDIILGKMLQPSQNLSTDREMNYMCSTNVTWNGIDLSVLKQMWFSPSEIKTYLLQKGDLLVAEGGDVAVASIWNNEVQECCIQNALHLVRGNKKDSNRLLYYWLYYLKHSGYIDLICNKATIAHFTKEKFGETPFCIMPIIEQEAIAAFLDDQCGRIDGIIADMEQQIDVLKQYKISLITEAVTKGLDKGVPMEDSGIDWIGKIAEHWEVKRLKYICDLKTGSTPSNNEGINYEKNGYNWYTPSDFNLSLIMKESERYMDNNIVHRDKIELFKEGAVFVVGIGATVGKVGYCVKTSYCNQQITAISPRNVDGKYLLYFIFSQSDYIKNNALYTTLPIINNSYLANIYCLLPPAKEQNAIASFLDKKCGKIAEIITQKQQAIETLRAYKKSLIYECVTGKRRV
ncbi:MAG: restriction endonuclease subunit S [Tannerella sp.]|jgi:type I restriction enzyme S subunit|nr:restriction endonuclease subunit S [Tannerella sp.]